MSDYEGFEPDPLRLTDDEGNEFLYDRQSAFLYTFMGRLSCYDHVFLLHYAEGDEVPTGTYVWSDDPLYDKVADYIQDNDFPQCLNGFKVSKQDKEIFRWNMGLEALDEAESFPSDWLGGETK